MYYKYIVTFLINDLRVTKEFENREAVTSFFEGIRFVDKSSPISIIQIFCCSDFWSDDDSFDDCDSEYQDACIEAMNCQELIKECL